LHNEHDKARGAILLSTNIQNIAVFLRALGKEILRFKKF